MEVRKVEDCTGISSLNRELLEWMFCFNKGKTEPLPTYIKDGKWHRPRKAEHFIIASYMALVSKTFIIHYAFSLFSNATTLGEITQNHSKSMCLSNKTDLCTATKAYEKLTQNQSNSNRSSTLSTFNVHVIPINLFVRSTAARGFSCRFWHHCKL